MVDKRLTTFNNRRTVDNIASGSTSSIVYALGVGYLDISSKATTAFG
jgi:hypothetical protein